jgi:hypothetical protein
MTGSRAYKRVHDGELGPLGVDATDMIGPVPTFP